MTATLTKIPLVDLKAQYDAIKPQVDAAIHGILDKTAFIMGPAVQNFETEFAAFTGSARSVGVSSGTTALHLALASLGVSSGDEVIVPAHTFIATAEAVCQCGATPVFADLDESTFAIDANELPRLLTPKTRAIIVVHIYGRQTRMQPIMEFAREHGLKVIEDCAQSHGAFTADGRSGAVGDAGCFSFYPGKNLGAYGDGGAVTTNDHELADRMRMLANHGRTKKYEHDLIGYNYRLDALQAAVLSVKLPHLAEWNAARLRLARRYNELLAGLPLTLPEAPEGHVFHLYVVRTPKRDALQAALKEEGIESGIHYPIPLHKQPCFAEMAAGVRLPKVERVAEEILSLPLYPEMTGDQQDRVVKAVKGFLGE